MNTRTNYELRFQSLFDEGRAFAFPIDAFARTLQASRSSGESLCRSPQTPWPRVEQLLELERPCFPS